LRFVLCNGGEFILPPTSYPVSPWRGWSEEEEWEGTPERERERKREREVGEYM